MRHLSDLKLYQKIGVDHLMFNDDVRKATGGALFYDMGLGKTVTTLTAIAHLLALGEVKRVLIIAPKRVAQHTWSSEVRNWSHTAHLRVSVAVGTEPQRLAALRADSDIYTINRENVMWLVSKLNGKHWPFDMVVIDELSSFKSSDSKRFRVLKTVRRAMPFVVGLTGTPMPNSYEDLWSQLYLLDKGERLGRHKKNYLDTYFTNRIDYGAGRTMKYDLKPGAAEEIQKKIGDICISMSAKDWLDLPPRIDVDMIVPFPAPIRALYDDFVRKEVLALPDGPITPQNATSLMGKLLQFCNGFVYSGEEKVVKEVHDVKIEMLDELLESLQGSPLLCFYSFKADYELMFRKLKHHKPHLLGDKPIEIDRWNGGEYPFLITHPASAGHGLNMQLGEGYNSTWYQMPWSSELYNQGCARLDRQGAKRAAVNTRLLIDNTVDMQVLDRVLAKTADEKGLLDAVKAIIAQYK